MTARDGNAGGLTIGQLAERTGAQPGTLRMWESRYGFPRARRLPSGHRRYAEEDVERVLDVLRRRATGLSLPAAIRQATSRAASAESVFAALRERLPELPVQPLRKGMLVPMSRAIEDEAGVSGERCVLIGSFQRVRFYRQVESRWRALAAGAEMSVVFADFEAPRAPAGAPAEVPLDGSHPLAREWALLWDGPRFGACLAARERPDPVGDDRERLFDVVWSADPRAAREAARAALALAAALAPELDLPAPERLDEPPRTDADTAARATALTNRMLAYVGERVR